MELNGQILHLIHQWQSIGVALLLQLLYHNGARPVIGGKDGHLLGQIFHFFHQMETLISDKAFRCSLETAIGSHKWPLVLNFLF
jgi:hypothetical protein